MRVLNLGAGVQSSTLLMMIVQGEVPRPDHVIFADTGWEPRAVYEWLGYLKKQAASAGVGIHVVSAGNIRADVIESLDNVKVSRIGQPPFYIRGPLDEAGASEGRLWRKCSTEYKINPIRAKIRELAGVRKGGRFPRGFYVEQWYGISVDEVQRMRDPRDPWAINYYPLIERGFTRNDCQIWMIQNGYPTPPRSACIGCPFHSDDEWRRLRDESPEEWADAVDFDRRIRRGIPGVSGEAFLHRSIVPLDEVDLTTDKDRGQMTLWGGECEGICGV